MFLLHAVISSSINVALLLLRLAYFVHLANFARQAASGPILFLNFLHDLTMFFVPAFIFSVYMFPPLLFIAVSQRVIFLPVLPLFPRSASTLTTTGVVSLLLLTPGKARGT